MKELPHWEEGTPAILCVTGPHAIPVSTPVRVSGSVIRFALGSGRDTLQRIRSDPRVAFCLLGEGLAFTAHGNARVLKEELDAAPVTGVELEVERVQDHLADGRTEMVDGARWRWLDHEAAESEPRIRDELRRL